MLGHARDNSLSSVLEASPIGIAILNRSTGQRLFVNTALVKIFGAASRSEMLKQDISKTWVDESDLVRAMSAFRDNENLANFEAERLRLDGSRWWVLMNTQPVVFEGVDAGIVWHVDITARKKAEDAARAAQKASAIAESQMRMSIESMSEGFVYYDADERLVICNSRFRDLYGYSEMEAIAGVSASELFELDSLRGAVARSEFAQNEFGQRRENTRRDGDGRFELQLKDGRWLQIHERVADDGGVVSVQADISEYKTAEKALRDSEERFALAMQSTNEIMYDTIVETMATRYSSGNRADFGLPDWSEDGDAWARLIHPDDLPIASAALADLVKGKTDRLDCEYRVRDIEGNWRWIHQNGVALRDENDRTYRIVGSAGDITGRKKAELALTQSEQRLRVMLETSPVAIVIIRNGGKSERLYYNKSYETLIAGDQPLPDADLSLSYINKEDREQMIRTVSKYGRIEDAEIRRRRPNGEEFWALLNSQRIEYEGGPADIFWLIDITARKHADDAIAAKEAQLRSAIDNMSGGIFMVDRDLNLQVFNDNFARYYEISDGVIKVGAPLENVLKIRAKRGDYGPGDPETLVRKRLEGYRDPKLRWIEDRTPSGHVIELLRAPTEEGGVVAIFNDITERKQVEEAVILAKDAAAAAEKQLLDAISNISDGFVLFDENDKLVICNDHYKNLIPALAGQKVPGTPFKTIAEAAVKFEYPDEAPRQIAQRVDVIMKEHQTPTGDMILLHMPNGRWIRSTERRTDAGGYVGVRADVTELKRIQDELAQQRDVQEATLETASQGIAAFDGDHKLLTYNTHFADIFQFNEGVLKEGAHIKELATDVNLRLDKSDPRQIDAMVWVEMLTQGKSVQETTRGLDGQYYQLESRALPDGGFVMTLADITDHLRATRDLQRAREQSEETERKMRAILETLPIGILVMDAKTRVDYWNEAYINITGLSDQVLGQSESFEDLIRYVYSTFGHTADGSFEDFLAERQEVSMPDKKLSIEQSFRERDFDIQHISAPLLTGGYVNAMVDITPQKTAQRDALVARDQAEAAARAKSSFLAAMSHEIRTPMNGVIGMLDLLTKSSLDENQRDMADTIRSSAFSLLQIIDDILDFSKIEAGHLKFENVPFSICAAVESVADSLVPGAGQKGLDVFVYVDPAIPEPLLGDAVRLRQILINLLGNAIKFTKAGRIIVRATLVPSEAAGRTSVDFSVRDTGIGIPKESQSLLFDPFVQAESSTTRRFGGTGLGLSICAHLVEIQGGRIDVDSTLGFGSTFRVVLSYDRVISDDGDDVPEHNDLAGLNVLVVTQEKEIGNNLGQYLTHWQARVRNTKQFKRVRQIALKAARDGDKFDVIVFGVAWSRKQQDDMCAAIRELPDLGGTRFVLMTTQRMLANMTNEPDQVLVSVSPLRRAVFLSAVAIAAGRESPEVRVIEDQMEFEEIDPLSEAEAEARGSLILVAEDNLTNQHVILRQLNRMGYTAVVAADGREALTEWNSRSFGLVLTDCHMPEMDGFELCAALRRSEQEAKSYTPIIAITANALEGEAERCLAAGMDDFMAKPVELVTLNAVLQKWLPGAVPEFVAKGDNAGADDGDDAINLTRLAEMMGDNNPAYLKETLEFFWSTVDDTPDLLQACIADEDAEGVKNMAHAAKGATLSAAAGPLSQLLQEVEAAAVAEDWPALKAMEPIIAARFDEVDQFIHQLSD